MDLLRDLEDKIILKYRKRINQLEKTFVDNMTARGMTMQTLSGERNTLTPATAEGNKTPANAASGGPVSILTSK
jgi:hypothetical protein